ncbi:MAG: ferritin-like domain-containing protein [Acidimicrobiales bacterium]
MPTTIDLEGLGFETGAHLLVRRALVGLAPGERLGVRGREPALAVHLPAWCRAHGHGVESPTAADRQSGVVAWVVTGSADRARWAGAERAGRPGPGEVESHPSARWGLAARGALVEADGTKSRGTQPLFDLDVRELVWADLAPKLYAQAVAGQGDPATAVDWAAPTASSPEVEAAVVQVMTFLVENEQAALVVPARFLGRIHPHFREVVQLLAVQVADEARHIEVFTRRALLGGGQLGTSGAGGRASLETLLAEPDFALASFLLSVLGEGSFLNLLAFLERHAPDPVTRQVCRLALQDEARHVAFGLAHLQRTADADPGLRSRLRAAMERRHDALADTAGLNEEVFDSLVVLAAGSWDPAAIATGFQRVQQLQAEMDDGRQRRLVRLGFPATEAGSLSVLHTRNFM